MSDLSAVRTVAAMLRDRALAELAGAAMERRGIEAERRALAAVVPARIDADTPDAGLAAVADAHFRVTQAQRQALMPALARAAAAEEVALRRAVRAVGRTEALRHLAEVRRPAGRYR